VCSVAASRTSGAATLDHTESVVFTVLGRLGHAKACNKSMCTPLRQTKRCCGHHDYEPDDAYPGHALPHADTDCSTTGNAGKRGKSDPQPCSTDEVAALKRGDESGVFLLEGALHLLEKSKLLFRERHNILLLCGETLR
jgi:hypothetical protein